VTEPVRECHRMWGSVGRSWPL